MALWDVHLRGRRERGWRRRPHLYSTAAILATRIDDSGDVWAKGMLVIEVESSREIRASREAVWRHLTRAPEWYRWYPGLHGTTASESITSEGHRFRATGQMGRMLYRGEQEVVSYQLLQEIAFDGARKPWLSAVRTVIRLEPSSPNCRVVIEFSAQPGFSFPGRLLLTGTLRRRLQDEADAFTERLASFVEYTMPHH